MMVARCLNAFIGIKTKVAGPHRSMDLGIRSAMETRLRKVKSYFGQDLGEFYAQPINRLMLYPFFFTFFLIECGTFWLIYLGTGFVVEYMAFVTVYTLHKAAVYAVGIVMADISAHHLLPSWGSYAQRSIGRQWMIWSLGLAFGFVVQRTMVKALVPVYAPDVISYFIAHPQARLSTLNLLAILLPYWILVVFLTLRIALSKQRIRKLADAIRVLPANDPVQDHPINARAKRMPVGSLSLGETEGNGAIALADITHVTVEDHYCRVNYTSGQGLKSEMIRLPLKEMLHKLPDDHFLRIHRSHVVNREHISRLARCGRDHKVVLHGVDVELPISRSRFKQLKTKMMPAGNNKPPE